MALAAFAGPAAAMPTDSRVESARPGATPESKGSPLVIWIRRDADAESCPGSGELTTRVWSRVSADASASASKLPARSAFVHFSRAGAGYRADIALRDAEGHSLGQRVISSMAGDCSDVAEAVVLTLTLLAEGTIDSLPMKSHPPPAQPTPRASPHPPSVCPEDWDLGELDDPEATPPPRWADLSAGPWLAWQVLPGAGLGVRVAQTLGFGTHAGLRAGAEYASSRPVDFGVDRYRFSVTSGWVGLALRHPLGPRFYALWETELLVGVTHAAVLYAQPPLAPGDFLFYGVRGGAGLTMLAIDPLTVSLGAHVRALLRRRTYRAEGQEQPVWEQPSIGLSTEMAVGATFW